MTRSKTTAAERLNPAPTPVKASRITKNQAINVASNILYAAGLDIDPKIVKRQTKGELVNFINMASLISRRDLAGSLGQSFGGKRDLYNVLGWKKEIQFSDYLNMYERNGIGARVIDIKADECWRKFAIIHDGESLEDYKDDTKFLKAWNELVERLSLPAIFSELDIALGISRFSIIVVGVKGDEDYSKPLDPNGKKQIEFLRVLDEGQITMSTSVSDPFSPRYGLPESYSCQFEDGGASFNVHWTRVVHFKQGRGRSNVYGIPGLQRSFNNLQDLEKVVGSSSEAFWQHIRRIFILAAREGFNLAQDGTPEYSKFVEQIEKLEHEMSPTVRVRNMDVNQLSHAVVDGRNTHDVLIEDIAATEGIPKRILMGSERGELASSQDESNWGKTVNARQTKTCEPWLRQFIKYLYTYNFIPAPSSGKFNVEWLPIYEMNQLEKVDLGIKKIEFLDKATDGNLETEKNALVEIMRETLDGYKPPKETDEEVEPESSPLESDEDGAGDGVEIGTGLQEQAPVGNYA